MFIDCDILFTKNVDHLFENGYNMYARPGARSPLNSGLFVATPSIQAFVDMCDIVSSGAYEPTKGWFGYGPIPDWFPHNKQIHDIKTDWTFYCASSDQGMLYCYFFCYQVII